MLDPNTVSSNVEVIEESSTTTYYQSSASLGEPIGIAVFSNRAQVQVGNQAFEASESILDISIEEVHTELPVAETEEIGTVYDFKVKGEGYNFKEPVVVTLKINDKFGLTEIGQLQLAIFDEDSKQWKYYGGEVDYANRIISAQIPHFSWITQVCPRCKIKGFLIFV